MLQESSTINKCYTKFQEVSNGYNADLNGEVILSHFGEFSQELVNSISVSVENRMIESNDKKGVVKRMFSILVEGLQNIRIHGEKDNEGHQTSFLAILQTEAYYKLTIANLVNSDSISSIADRINQLNGLNLVEVKELYMEVLSNGIMSNKGGAGLGFITMSLKSKNELIFSTEKISDLLSLLTLEVKVDRVKLN